MSLTGVRVLDLTRVLAGPYCSMMLAELGADVIKVEEPSTGDESRYWQPFINGQSGYYFSVNRSKRSLTLNMKHPEAKKVIHDLTVKSDVVLQNFAPGVPKRLGVDYDTLSAINPRLVYCSISGFGDTGPYRDRKAYDPVLQAMSGLMSVTGPIGGEPLKCGAAITDVSAAIFGAFSVAVSLFRRERTGKGQYIDLSMFDSSLALLTFQAAIFLCEGQVPAPFGSENPTRVPSANYPTSDGRFLHITVNDRQWAKFCQVIGAPEAAQDPDFSTTKKRVDNRERVNALIADRVRTKTAEEWDRIFDEAGLPAGPVNTIDRALTDPQTVAREMVKRFLHPIAGSVQAVDMPYRFDEDGTAIRSHPPLLGEHTDEVLTGVLGYSTDEVGRLRTEGVIG